MGWEEITFDLFYGNIWGRIKEECWDLLLLKKLDIGKDIMYKCFLFGCKSVVFSFNFWENRFYDVY